MVKESQMASKAVNVAALLAVIASLFATVSLITSSKAGGTASDQKTAALGFMILRLESETSASNYRTQAQMDVTLTDIAFARADATDNIELKTYLDNLGYTYIAMSNYYLIVAENAENTAQTYYDAYTEAIDSASTNGKVADYRSTGALIFNVGAMICGTAGLLRRKELLYVFIPIFAIGAGYLIMSLF
jgi:hypothetical protein